MVGLLGGLISVVPALMLNVPLQPLNGSDLEMRPMPVSHAAVYCLFVGLTEEFSKCFAATMLMRKLNGIRRAGGRGDLYHGGSPGIRDYRKYRL